MNFLLVIVVVVSIVHIVQGGRVEHTNKYARSNYELLTKSNGDLPIELMIVVKQRNVHLLEEELLMQAAGNAIIIMLLWRSEILDYVQEKGTQYWLSYDDSDILLFSIQ